MNVELYESADLLSIFVCVVDNDNGKCVAVMPIKTGDNLVAIGVAELLASNPESWRDWHGTEIPDLMYERGILNTAYLLAHYDGVWHEDNQAHIRRNNTARAFLTAYKGAIESVSVSTCDECKLPELTEEN